MNGQIVSIEADIGAGKSTFLRLLNKYYPEKFCIIYEPLDKWLSQTNKDGQNILELLYTDIKRWAYTFQHNAFLTRVQKIEQERDDTKCIVTERSVLSDFHVFAKMLKDQGNIDELEYSIYLNWMDFLNEKYKTIPNKIVYLRTSPETAHQRLRKRSRDEEKSVSLEYLRQVTEYHEKWLLKEENIEVIVIDGNQDFEENEERFKEMVREIFGF
jgi:deoxynucleoside kinase